MSPERCIEVRAESDATRAVLDARRYAQDLGFGETASRMIATAVSELVRNILRHGGGRGAVRLRSIAEGARCAFEVEASDSGPGIDDIERALGDHFSTAGTLGLGLPGVKRMMDDFSIESKPGEGTRVTARKWR